VSKFVSQQRQAYFLGNWMVVAEWRDVPQHSGSTTVVC